MKMDKKSANQFRFIVDLVAIALAVAVSWLIVAGNTYGCCVPRNFVPLGLSLAGFVLVTRRYGGSIPHVLALLGFSGVAIGLTGYLHAAFLFDWKGLASTAKTPELLFRYLPFYVLFAGAIGAAIGWIIGRNVKPRD